MIKQQTQLIHLGSRIRTKLFTYFFSNESAKLYLREIASLLKIDPGNLSKELKQLEEERLFFSQVRGRQKYYFLNRSHPLYEEIKGIVYKTEGIEGGLRKILSGHEGIAVAFLYGSFARGHINGASDLDLVIVGQVDEDRLLREISEFERSIGREVNYTLFDPKEFRKKSNEKDSFLWAVIQGKKKFLVGHEQILRDICQKRA